MERLPEMDEPGLLFKALPDTGLVKKTEKV